MLKVQLIHDTLGVLNCNPDPDGLNDFDIELKRSKENDGVFYEFGVNLKYNKSARDFIQNVHETEGIQGVITVNLYEYDPNKYNWSNIYSGQLRLSNYNLTEDYVQTNLEQIGFERKFLNLVKRDVEIGTSTSLGGVSLPIISPVTIPLAPKTIKKQAFLNGPSDWNLSGFTSGFPSIVRIGGALNNTDFEESRTFLGTDIWTTPADANEVPSDTKNYVLKTKEAGAYVIEFNDINFDLSIEVTNVGLGFLNVPDLTSWDIALRYQLNDGPIEDLWSENYVPGGSWLDGGPIPTGDFDSAEIGSNGILYKKLNINPTIPNKNLTLKPEDEIYIWFDSDVDFAGGGSDNKDVGFKLNDSFNLLITGDTVSPETTANVFLVFEFLQSIIRYITDQHDCLVSDFFGRTDLGYAEDGEGSLLAITNGANIRQLNKTIFGKWEDIYSSLEAIFCLGWGFERKEDGTQVIRVEKKEYFFNKNITALTLQQVSNLSKVSAKDRYIQTIEVGYPEVENINQVNGIDEFNSLRRFGTPIAETKNQLRIVSEYRASGFEIESQRRLIGSTKESKLDDKNFFIALLRDGVGGYRVEQGSDYTSVTGVFDPATAYNIRIRPGAMIRNWKSVISAVTLRNTNKIIKFEYGEFNYELIVDGVAENDDIEMLDSDALWYCDLYEFTSKFTRDNREAVRAARNGVIKFLDWSNIECEGYLMSLKNTIEENEADFVLLRVKR